MNKRIKKKIETKWAKKFLKMVNETPADDIKVDKNGRITNWDELSQSTKDWLMKG